MAGNSTETERVAEESCECEVSTNAITEGLWKRGRKSSLRGKVTMQYSPNAVESIPIGINREGAKH